ncbi:PTS sugar transporter subunit IIA [Streptomyces albofaciens JCM 4342]|uniref:PTS sugar transporter subunit IIA n=1 Tax=Streptomyces albofaciens TaxID=66866 RepID=UPI001239A0D0|nr:PTS sugar transporter subunit IIA [Streptomyces albofaciens]KAA6213353.1 PTS sugar transporter subunit IIA [Streptomyces albofaciens JCM 4342]
MTRSRTRPQAPPRIRAALADYLPEQRIHPHARATTTHELLRSLTRDLHAAGTISNPHTFTRALHTRLAHTPHGFHGIALLTARTRTVNTPAAAFARITPELTWRGADNRPVRDVFVLTAPYKLKDTGSIQAYSILARHTAHPGFRHLLAGARTADELYALFSLIR